MNHASPEQQLHDAPEIGELVGDGRTSNSGAGENHEHQLQYY